MSAPAPIENLAFPRTKPVWSGIVVGHNLGQPLAIDFSCPKRGSRRPARIVSKLIKTLNELLNEVNARN